LHFLRHAQCILGIVDTHFHIIANQSYLGYTDILINTMLGLLARSHAAFKATFIESTTAGSETSPAWWPVEPASGFLRYCHLRFLVYKVVFFLTVNYSGILNLENF
jgi:hypothetical protein